MTFPVVAAMLWREQKNAERCRMQPDMSVCFAN